MFSDTDLSERHIIIKNASLKDATILDENYMSLIKDAHNYEERTQILELRNDVLVRINQLTQKLR